MQDIPVRRDAFGRKMYPGRFWEWPYEELPGQAIELRTYDEEMEYSIAVWTETNTNMPSMRQLKYVLYLLGTRQGADPSAIVWDNKRRLAQGINWLLKQPLNPGATDFTGRYPR